MKLPTNRWYHLQARTDFDYESSDIAIGKSLEVELRFPSEITELRTRDHDMEGIPSADRYLLQYVYVVLQHAEACSEGSVILDKIFLRMYWSGTMVKNLQDLWNGWNNPCTSGFILSPLGDRTMFEFEFAYNLLRAQRSSENPSQW